MHLYNACSSASRRTAKTSLCMGVSHRAGRFFAWLIGSTLGLITPSVCVAEPPPIFHFKPSDHALGDVHPFFKDGECFLFSLKPGKYDSVLACSKDWLHWNETPITHTPLAKNDWFAPYFVLGVFRDEAAGVYRSFHGHANGRMVSSESDDLLHWSCAPKEFSVPPADYYERRRDPFLFWIPERKEYGCVMTTWMKDCTKETGGAISLATSPDLKQWKDHGPIIHPGDIGEPECPQMFKLGAHWYLLASIYNRAVGRPVYWRSSLPTGPWNPAPEGQLDGKDLCAAQIAFTGDTPVLFGWIPLEPAQPGKQHWGGHLALPREVYTLPDGSLGTRLPERFVKLLAALTWQSKGDFTVTSKPHLLEGGWKNVVAQFDLNISDPHHETRVQFAPLGEVVITHRSLRIEDGKGQCWSELPATWSTRGKIAMHLFIEDNIVEVFADNRWTLAARLPRQAGESRLSFCSDSPTASVQNLRLTIPSK